MCPPSRVPQGSVTHLGRVGVGLVRVDALVVDDVLEGAGHEASLAALVPVHGGAVNEVLGAQGHQLARLQLHLPLQGPHGAEGPARPARALRTPGAQTLPRGAEAPGGSGSRCLGGRRSRGPGRGAGAALTWFFTSVTQPWSLQSTVSGVSPRRCGRYRELRFARAETLSPVNEAATSSLVWGERKHELLEQSSS